MILTPQIYVCYNHHVTSIEVFTEKYPSPVEGTGLENQEVGNGAGVRIPLSPPLFFKNYLSRDGAVVARRAHNPEAVGSNPSPATKMVR